MDNKLAKIADRFYTCSAQLEKECINYLTKILKSNNNGIYWKDKDLPEYICVPYDGGNHPEYASNVFSTVYGIFIKENTIYLNIEDCDKYDISFVDADKIYNICYFIDSYKTELNIKL